MNLKREKFLFTVEGYDAWIFSDTKDKLYLGFFDLEEQTFININPMGYYKEDGKIPLYIIESAKYQATRIFKNE